MNEKSKNPKSKNGMYRGKPRNLGHSEQIVGLNRYQPFHTQDAR